MLFYNWPSYLNLSVGVISGVISIAIAAFSWKRRFVLGASTLIWMSMAALLWSVAYIVEIISWPLWLKETGENFQYLAISALPIIYFAFVRTYSAWKVKIKNFVWVLFLIQPVFSQVMIWTDSLHHWFRVRSYIEYAGLPAGSFPGFHINEYGWGFWFFSVYVLTFLLVDLILMLIAYFRTPLWSRGKMLYITFGMLIPWLTSLIGIPSLISAGADYIFLISISVSMILIGLGLLRVQITDLMPIARKTLLDQLNDAVIVLDNEGRMIEFNNSTRKSFKDLSSRWFGRQISDYLPQLSALKFNSERCSPEEIEISVKKGDGTKYYEVRISRLEDESRMLAGWLLILHDITNKKEEAERLVDAESQMKQAFTNSQRHAAELSLLRLVNEQLNQATSLRQALLPSLRTILEISNAEMIWALLLENEGQNHRTIQYVINEKEGPLTFMNPGPNDSNCLQDFVAGKLENPTEYESCSCGIEVIGSEEKPLSHISFPLKSGVSSLGVVNIHLAGDRKLEEESYHLIDMVCDSLSISLERIRLFKMEYDQRRTAETMQEIGATLTASLDLDEVLDLLLEQIGRLVPYDAGNVMFLDGDRAWVTRTTGYEFLGKKIADSVSLLSFQIKETANLRALVNGKHPLFIADVHADPNWIMTDGTPYFRSWLGAPIIIDDKVVAVFSLEKKEPGFYSQVHAERLTTICTDAALAIQNARLYEAGVKRIRELESLQLTLKDISSELDLKKLLYDITERAVNLLGASGGILGEYHKENEEIEIILGINNGADMVGMKFPISDELPGFKKANHKPFAIQDYSSWEGRHPDLAKFFPNNIIQVPLEIGDELVGAIAITDSRPQRVFGDDDLRLIGLFAQQATIAINNARLFTDARRRAEEAETMRQAGAIVASSLEQKQALRLILEQLALVIPCDSSSILLPKDDELEIVDERGLDKSKAAIGLRIPMGDDQPGSVVFRGRKPIIVRNMDKEYPSFNNIANVAIKSWIGVPLIFQKEVIGLLAIDSLKENSYTEDHARLAQAFADQVAIALENVRLYEEAVKSAKRLAGLYKMSQQINANLKPEEVYRAIHKATIELMNPDAFILSLYDEDAKIIHDVYFVDHGIPQPKTDRPLGQGFSGRILKEKKTIMYNNFNLNMLTKTKAVLVGDDKDPTMVRSLIIVPLKLGKKVKGVISAQSYRGDAFTEEDKETLELLAAHAVIALENAQLFSEVQQLASTDSLTHIYNRRQFFELAEQEFERSRRYGRPFSIIMFDIDLFKKVNDTYGHIVGDVVLERVAEICKGALRDVDIIARYGGEEFVILLPETTATEAQLMAERLRQLVARTTMNINEIKINITLSFGVVEVDETTRNTEDLLDRSDQALYHSKGSGRNCVSIWTPEMRLQNEPNGKSHLHH